MKKGVSLVFGTAVISGVSIFLNKFGVGGFDPAHFTASKNILVALLLLSTLLVLNEWRTLKELPGKAWAQLATIGLIGGSIPFLLFFTGLKLTTGAQGSFLHKTMFIWVAIIATVTLKEQVNKKMVIGGLLLLAGNLVALKIVGWTFGSGDLLIILATLFWSAEITLSKHLLNSIKELPGRVVAFGRMGFGSLFLLGYLGATGKITLYSTMTSSQWLWIALTGALLYGYVYTFYEGLKFVPASTATAILLFGSVVTTLLAFIATGTVGWHQVIGGLLLIAGTVVFVGIRLPSITHSRN